MRFFSKLHDGKLPAAVNMKLYAHLFVLQLMETDNKVMASELRIDYSDKF